MHCSLDIWPHLPLFLYSWNNSVCHFQLGGSPPLKGCRMEKVTTNGQIHTRIIPYEQS